MPRDVAVERQPVLSTLPAASGESRLALVVVLVSAVLFAIAVPFAKVPLAQVWAFIPVYQSALVVNDVVTAVLLFGQFGISRSNALLVLASGFLFTAFMAVAHALSFPGLFSQAGLLGGGGQTTAWLYFFWHGAFPLLVLAYVLLKDGAGVTDRLRTGAGVLYGIGAAFAVACGFTLLAAAGQDSLPVIMSGNGDLPAKYVVAWGTCLLCLAPVFALWRRKPHSVLDLWLMVVMCAWVFDVALSSVFNAGRFSLGFYAGRIYGLLAASFVLIVLLLENGKLYAQLLEARKGERAQAREALARQAERLRILHEIDRAIIAEQAPEAVAAAAIQPLRELLGVPRAIVNLFDLGAGEVEWLAAAGRHRTHIGPGVRYSIRLMGDVEALKRGEPQVIDTHALPPGPEVDALLASGVDAYMAIPMIAGGELIGALSFGGEQAAFPPEQIKIATEAAAQIAIAITQARLSARVRRQAEDLELRVRERTAELQAANQELEAFSYSVSHDLRSPLRAIDGYAAMIEEDYSARLDAEGHRLIKVVRREASRMGQLIDDLLAFSRVGRKPVAKAPLDMAVLVREVAGELAPQYPAVRLSVGALPSAAGDRSLLRQVWANLVGNALKYSSKREAARVEIGGRADDGEAIYWVRDNGAGFDMSFADKLFRVFHRLHKEEEFSGTGVGLAIVQRVVSRHGGRVWGEGKVGEGACFYFALPGGAGQ
ncbi:MAG TPA: MASE4 domain-containing protein [Burkholderiales bacterium]